MKLTVLYFAVARERAGCSRDELTVKDGATVREAVDEICRAHPSLEQVRKHLRVAVNQEFAKDDAVVPPNAELALIPPVSGGAGRFQVVNRELKVEEAIALVSAERYGGLVTFTGTVRNQTRGKSVVRLEYEAYAEMAVQKFEQISAEVEAKWPGVRLSVLHRVGVLVPGEIAVVIAAAAPHRKEAFAAAEHTIERLKQDVPIWKKEVYSDGEVWVGLGP